MLSDLLSDVLTDARATRILWQMLAIALCIALGWLLARLINAWLSGRDDMSGVRRIGVESFAQVLSPLLIAGLLWLAKLVLSNYLHMSLSLLRVALPIFLSLAVIRMGFYLLRRIFARHGQLGDTFVSFEKMFALLVWVGVTLYIAGMWPRIFYYLDHVYLPLGKHKATLTELLQGAVSIVVLMIVALWAGAALEERLMGMQKLHTSLRVVLARMSRALLLFVAVLVSLHLMDLDLTALSVFGGALGVGLGLGMQRIASNYVSGFIILLERSLKIGDMISVDKYSGKVTRINTRYTILAGLDGVETVLPNEMLISGPVLNQSLSSRAVRGSTKLTVAYGSDLAVVMPLLEELARSSPRVLAEPGPGVGLARFAPEGYELDLGFWIGDPESGTGGVVSDINKKIYALVQSGDITLAQAGIDTRLLDAHIASVVARIAHTDAN